MTDELNRKKRIVKNTILLYLRMILLMLISLYTSRVILNALGVVDYGIYNVVGGVVTMFSMISGSLSTAISRFLTFAIGKNDNDSLNKIFSTSVNIQFILSFIILLIAETLGLWFLQTKMVIPESRMVAAFWVYQFSLIAFVINLISVPYNAVIIAHERMSAFAYISILEAVGRLAISMCIVISPIDRLIFYAFLVVILGLIIRFTYGMYCNRNFSEAKYHLTIDKSLIKDMFGFAGWNFLGSSSMILREYGGNIIINLFCGPAVNASRALATKVNSTVQGFITNFTMAINPQITKSYASGDYDYMLKLIFKGSRFSFYMMLILSLPIMLNADYVLSLWLGIVPEYAATFVCLILLLAMIDILSNSLITTILATGKVRTYQIVVSSVQFLNIPISYVFLRLGYSPESVIIVAIILSNIALFLRLYMVSKYIPIKIVEFIKSVYLNVIIVALLSSILPCLLKLYINGGWTGFIFTSVCSICCTMFIVYFVGCKKTERNFLTKKFAVIIKNKLMK